MKIGIIGTGSIGGTLAVKLAAHGHEVKVANSRGPETIDSKVLKTGAVADTAEGAVQNAEVIIVAVPLPAYEKLAPVLAQAPDNAVVVDTGNYYPGLFGEIAELEDGAVQALWAQEQLGRPVIKAWNAVLAGILQRENPASALPVAGNDELAKKKVFKLVADTGFTPVDAGSAADAWRQEPGSPAYCVALSETDLRDALALAQKSYQPARRELILKVIADRAQQNPDAITSEYVVALNRLVTAAQF